MKQKYRILKLEVSLINTPIAAFALKGQVLTKQEQTRTVTECDKYPHTASLSQSKMPSYTYNSALY